MVNFQYQFVILNDGIAQQVAADFVELGFGLRAVELEFDEFSDARGFHCREAVMMDRVAHRHTLGVEHTLFGQHDNFGFHRGATLRTHGMPANGNFPKCPSRNCRVTSAPCFVYRVA